MVESSNSRSYRDIFSNGHLYGSDCLFDGSIVSEDGTEFEIHKLILSKGSGYFSALFRNNFGRNIVIPGIDEYTLERILVFLYTGDVYLDEDSIANMMIAADYLLIDILLMRCKTFAVQNISLKCCIPLLSAAWVVESLGIKECCYRYVQINFESLVNREDPQIAKLPIGALMKLLEDDSLGVENENTVYMAIKLWAEENNSDRHQDITELLACLRISPLSTSLQSVIDNSFLSNQYHEKSIKSAFSNTSTLSFAPNRCPSKMYLILCNVSFPHLRGALEIFLTYDGQLDIWRKIGETESNFDTLIPINQCLFMFNTISNQIQAFNLKDKTWFEPNYPLTARQAYHVVKNRGRIYALGGGIYVSDVLRSDVEYYSAPTDTWYYTTALPHINVSGVVVLNDEIHVIGFLEEFDRLEMKAFVFDTVSDSWLDISEPKFFRTQFAIINFDRRIYILGGSARDNSLMTSVEMYDPDKRKWEIFPDLPVPYTFPQAIVLNDQLMVYEDLIGSRTFRNPPSVWNKEIKCWRLTDNFSPLNEIHQYQFCAIEDPLILKELMKENRDMATAWERSPFAALHYS